MLSSQLAQSLKSYGHFSDPDLSQSHACRLVFSSKANTSIHGERGRHGWHLLRGLIKLKKKPEKNS